MDRIMASNIHFLICLLSLCIATITCEFPLKGRSFSLKSVMTKIPHRGDIVQIYEQYSVEQRRANVRFKMSELDSQDKVYSFYFDSRHSNAALVEESERKVEQSSPKQVTDMIQLPDLSLDPVADDFIMGPARILFLVEKSRDMMRPANVLIGDNLYTINNVLCRGYEFEYVTNLKERLKFTIYYRETGGVQSPLPMQVIITNNIESRLIYFGQVEFSGIDQDQFNSRREAIYDSFMFRLALGFPKLMQHSAETLFADRPIELSKFSFRARENFREYSELESLIAFDGRLSTLRQDLIDSSGTSGLFRKQIFNFQLNRMYDILEQVNGVAPPTVIDLRTRQEVQINGEQSLSNQCKVARILPDESGAASLSKLTIGKILTGADQFVFMGRARVRGIAARVYEAIDADLPFWLEKPIGYRTVAGKEKTRLPNEGTRENNNSNNLRLSVVIYLADQAENHPLLLIEIYKTEAQSMVRYEKRSISIHDFTWDLDFGEDQVSEMFSVHDVCSSRSGVRNNGAQVSMLLESSTKFIDWTKVSADATRELFGGSITEQGNQGDDIDLILLGALQRDFKLPATMIHDTNIRVLVKSLHQAGLIPGKLQSLRASFKVAEHPEELVELVYLGQTVDQMKMIGGTEGLLTRVSSFHECLFLATRRHKTSLIGFMLHEYICHIIGTDSLVDGSKLPSNLTEGNQQGYWEVYRIKQSKDDALRENKFMRDLYKTRKQFDLLGTKLYLKGLNHVIGGDVVELTLSKLTVDKQNHRDFIDGIGNQTQLGAGGDKFAGFGLIETSSGGGTRRIAPIPLESNHNWSSPSNTNQQLTQSKSTMTYEQCNAACLSNLECRSFSLCLRNAELECIISSSSFKPASVVSQISESLKDSRRSFKFIVRLAGNKVTELLRSSTCTLYNINFLDQFNEPVLVHIPISRRFIHAVLNRERCAELCLRLSLEVLIKDIQMKTEASSTMLQSAQTGDDAAQALSQWQEQRSATTEVCRSFYYLDSGKLTSLPPSHSKLVEARAIPDQESGYNSQAVNGYCLMSADSERFVGPREQPAKEGGLMDLFVHLDMYSFKIELFYEKMYGVRLNAPRLSKSESEAQLLASGRRDDISKETYSILIRVFERGDNVQEELAKDATSCARICFFQSHGPWPACRSFDIVIDLSQTDHSSTCYLNSITLNQAISAKRTDLIDEETSSLPQGLQVWHFEPRSGFAADEAILGGNLEMTESYLLVSRLSNTFGQQIGSFATFCVVLFGLISGFVLGIHSGRRWFNPFPGVGDDKDGLFDANS